MDALRFAEATRDLRAGFVSLLDSMAAVRTLAELNVHFQTEAELLENALRILMKHQDLERCSIFVLQGHELVCAAGRDLADLLREEGASAPPPPQRSTRRFRRDEGLLGQAARTGQLQYCDDCARDPRVAGSGAGASAVQGSLMCAPVLHGATVLAVVNVGHPRPFAFQAWHRQMLTIYCNVLAHMLVNQRAMQDLEQQVHQRTVQLELALSEAQQLKRRYEELSTVDELTGLHNRRFFFAEAEAALARSIRYGHPFCLLLIDLDYFKSVNDTYGHAAGDNALRDLAEALRRHIREGDILARFGGEEFVLALPGTPIDGARILGNRIGEHVRSMSWGTAEYRFELTVSIGIACNDAAARSESRLVLDDLLRQADQALYHCKANGRNQVSCFAEIPERKRRAAGHPGFT